jgi:hypothetical protein
MHYEIRPLRAVFIFTHAPPTIKTMVVLSKTTRASFISRVWADPVWSKVIAYGIWALMVAAWGWFVVELLPIAGGAYVTLKGSIAIPVWAFVLGSLVLVAALGALAWMATRRSTTATSSNKPEAEIDYGARITSVADGQRVDSPVSLRGTFETLPPEGSSVRIFEYIPAGDSYWPKSKVTVNASTKSWVCNVWFGDKPGVHHTLYVAFCGPDAEALIDHFLRAEETAKRPTGIKKLTRDLILKSPITVERGESK